MTFTAFPGHTTCRLRSSWPLPRWRSVARIGRFVTVSSAAGALCCVLVAGCGGDDDDSTPEAVPPRVRLDIIGDALAAVDAELPGPQQYFEVTANARLVRLFTADQRRSKVTTYVYLDGQVTVSGEPTPARGFTFEASAVAFDPETVLDPVEAELPGAVVEEFSIVATEGGGARYAAIARSERGGRIDIVLSATGEVLEVGPADDVPVPPTA